MARYKYELRRIHRKKVRKAKAKVKAFLKGELPKEKLTSLAKKLLEKQKRSKPKAA